MIFGLVADKTLRSSSSALRHSPRVHQAVSLQGLTDCLKQVVEGERCLEASAWGEAYFDEMSSASSHVASLLAWIRTVPSSSVGMLWCSNQLDHHAGLLTCRASVRHCTIGIGSTSQPPEEIVAPHIWSGCRRTVSRSAEWNGFTRHYSGRGSTTWTRLVIG